MSDFQLEPAIEQTSLFVCDLGDFTLRLVDDARYLWLLVIPRIAGITELYDLSANVRHDLTEHASKIAEIVKSKTSADKMNIATIGNIVPQFHLHIIARHKDDEAWPNPVWGLGQAKPYDKKLAEGIISKLNLWLSDIRT